MKNLFILSSLLLSTTLQAQNYSLKSVVIDEARLPIEAATCILTSLSDTAFMQAVVTDSTGYFAFESLVAGEYQLFVSHLIFESDTLLIHVNQDIRIDDIQLADRHLALDGVVIDGERPVVKATDGKLVYDVPLLIKQKIATNAFEALKNVPNIMGSNDQLQLVGTDTYTILLNGQATSMSTDQLVQLLKSTPASKVSNIEIMYSAPPQYNVRGAAINVILADADTYAPAFQGEGTLYYDQAHYPSYGGRANVVLNKPSLVTDFTIGAEKWRINAANDMHAIHSLDGHTYDIQQENRTKPDGLRVNTRLAFDFTMANKDKLTLTYTGDYGNHNSNITSNARYGIDGIDDTNIQSTGDNDGNDQLHNLKLAYNSHQAFNAGVDYTFYNEPGTQRYSEYSDRELLQSYKTVTRQRVDKILLYAGHEASLPKGWNLNYGANFGYSRNKNDYGYFRSITSQPADSVSLTNQPEYSASVYAGFSKSFTDKFSLQASLSGNYFKATVDNSVEGNKVLWDEFAPFVNANLSYVFSPRHILQGSFSSDVLYPPYWALSPDVVQLNAYSVVEGNPELKFAKSYESQLMYIFQSKYMLIGSYKYYADFFTQLPYQSDTELVNVFQMVNLDYRQTASLSLITPFKIPSILDTRATFSYVYTKDKDSDFFSEPYARSGNTFVFNITNTVNLSSKPNLKMDISGFYMSGMIQGVYDIGPMSNISAGIKWTFAKDRADLTAKVSDIFHGMDARTTINFEKQWSTLLKYTDAPMLSLTFVYRFGGYEGKEVDEVDKSRFGR